jgi:plastocyanin
VSLPMRKLLALIAAGALLLVSATAAANTVTVAITKNGYVPSSVTIVKGDTVQFTNQDTAAHQIDFKNTAGVSCTANPLVVQPSASASCTFANTGSYTYSDPNVKGNTYRGTITVNAPPESIALTVKPLLVTYGGKPTVSGTLSTQQAGQSIDVYGQACGANAASRLATVPTATGGVFTYTASPLQNTVYTGKSRTTTSNAVTVRVRPALRLTKVAPHRFALRVSATQSFAGKYAGFQRYNATLGRWVAVKTLTLKASTAGVAPTVLSTTAWRSSIAARLRVRVVMGAASVGTCYAPGLSNTISS